MFNKAEIDKKSKEFSLMPSDVERDYIQSWIIKEISEDKYLSPQLALKGSCALRKLYLPDTRFARDIDYSSCSHIDKDLLIDRLQNVGKKIEQQTGISFIEEVKVGNKNLPEEMKVDALEARMYFKGVYTDGKFDLKTQVDLTQGENLSLPPQNLPIIHPYFDKEALGSSNIRCQKLEEIIATKFITLIHRHKPGDFWDLVYGAFISNSYELNRGQLIRALLARTNFADTLEQTRRYFINLPVKSIYLPTWGKLLVPADGCMGFGDIQAVFISSIPTFFDEIKAEIRVFARRSIGDPLNNFRGKIISGGRKNHLLKVLYSNIERIAEPYKLEFYTRESDGKTNEYFWGFDRSGGTSKKVSIKRFMFNKIQEIEETQDRYVPQWEIEL